MRLPFTTLTTPLIGAFTAAALILSAAAPARADGDDTRRALMILGGVAAGGYLLHQMDRQRDRNQQNDWRVDRRDDGRDRDNPAFRRPDRHDDRRIFDQWGNEVRRPGPYVYDPRGNDRRQDWRDDRRWQDPRRDRQAMIPAQCIDTAVINGRRASVVSERCAGAGRLPSSCSIDIRTPRGRQEVFGVNCLSDRGYRIARY